MSGPNHTTLILLLNQILLRPLNLLQKLPPGLPIPRENMLRHQPPRRLSEPLEQREVAELVGAEHLEHLDGLVADVLDKVAHVARHDAHVAGDIVEGARAALRREDGDASAAADEEAPFVCVGVPLFDSCVRQSISVI